jgi:AraC-like DNA-binding protein
MRDLDDLHWRCYFHVERSVAHFPRLVEIGGQTRVSDQYKWEGSRLPPRKVFVFQYTISGEGFIRTPRGTQLVPQAHGFLCDASDPETSYGFPPGAIDPWRFIFLSFTGADAMVHEMIQKYGDVYHLPLNHPRVSWILFHKRNDNKTRDIPQSRSTFQVMSLLGELMDFRSVTPGESKSERLVRHAHEFINVKYGGRLKVEDIARQLKVSREHLTRVFLEVEGIGPGEMIDRRKLMRASELLRSTNLSCKEIAHRLGFDDPTQFSRCFKRIAGIQPIQFRRNPDWVITI